MHVIADFTVVPVGVGVSLSPYIAELERVLQASGLTFETHANGTNLEGDWEAVFGTIRACHERLHAMGVPRIHTDVKFGTRSDREQRMGDKLRSLREKLG
ncbi:MTH1187 family thiamine-binding protein [Mesoterricola sediminis]|uniref:Thiamine-binding protein domain-containing protein n=1 Tax=Mesoterricola sediminis TaxID=2927980 RepID=A0AA48KED1_9BACT|nr:MTH1187 family thiamine-binding protein [Mesoterricola sediminis]BDU77945.1 hypothetical protein METESE_29030 [Mesoterricola sediminis]